MLEKTVFPILSIFPFLEYPEDALGFYCVQYITVWLYSETWHNRNMQFIYIVRKYSETWHNRNIQFMYIVRKCKKLFLGALKL